MKKTSPKPPVFKTCFMCGFQEWVTPKEWLDHIKGAHSELYVPREKKNAKRPITL